VPIAKGYFDLVSNLIELNQSLRHRLSSSPRCRTQIGRKLGCAVQPDLTTRRFGYLPQITMVLALTHQSSLISYHGVWEQF
jgi:hypothetical protein